MKRLPAMVAVFAAGCASSTGGQPSKHSSMDAASAQKAEIDRVEDRVLPAPKGVPHSDNLIEVALDERGQAALTLDAVGGLRFWATLDGSRAPALVRGSLTNLDLNRKDNGWRAVGIDPAGAAVVLWIDKNGNASEVFATPPEPRALDAVVTKDDQVAVLGEDHVLRVLRSGRVVSSYSARSFRPTRIFEHQDGSLSLAAMLADKKETTLAIHRLQPAAGQWQATTSEHTLAIGAHQTPSQIRFSPSGGKLALFGRQGSVWHLHTVELASDKVYSSATDLPRARIPGGGWESETSFTTLGNVDVRRIDVSGEHKLITNFPGPPSHLLPTSIRARGSVLAAGVADHLFVIDSKARIWRYLGYGATQEGYQQLSPSGNRVAWRDTRGHGYVHDRTTGRTVPLLTTAGTNSGLFFATDDRVLGFYSPQRLVVFDASSGKPIDEIGGTVNQAQAVDGYLLLPYPGLLYRITDKGFEAVAILQGYARFSTLVKTAKGTRLLVLSKKDSKARLLRIGQASTMTADELAKLPVSNPHVDFALELISTSTLIDDRGRPYRQGGKLTRLSKDPRKVVSYQLPGTLSGRLVSLSPAGKYVLGTANTDVYVFDGDSGERAWGRPNAYPAASWSQDGSKVLLAARGGLGFEIVDSKSGKTAWKMCGHSFRASPAPPQRRRSNHLRMANICAR